MFTEAVYLDIKTKHDALVAAYSEFKTAVDEDLKAQKRDLRDLAANNLISTLMQLDTERTDATIEEVNAIFHTPGRVVDIMTNFEDAAKLSSPALVVAVMRSALAVSRVQFNPREIAAWDEFTNHYQDLVTDA